MRTKTLLAAAVLAAGLATSMAQSNVYSQNVVGYINVSLPTGFTMVANQLDLDGTGVNNTVQTVIGTNLPAVTVYAYSGGSYATAAYASKTGWSGNTNTVNAALNGGNGVFVKVGAPATLTLVGNVRQGALTKTYPTGFSIVGSQVPQAGLIQTDLGFTPNGTAGETIYQFKADQSGYNTAGYTSKTGWSPAQPTIGVAEGFWLKSGAGGTWTRNFSVQ